MVTIFGHVKQDVLSVSFGITGLLKLAPLFAPFSINPFRFSLTWSPQGTVYYAVCRLGI